MPQKIKLSEKDTSLINKFKFFLQFEKGLSGNSISAYERDIAQFASFHPTTPLTDNTCVFGKAYATPKAFQSKKCLFV